MRLLVLIGLSAYTAWAQLPERPVVKPVVECSTLVKRDFTQIPGAPVRVVSSGVSDDSCVVKGYVAPQVQFELRMPLNTYTGRYLQGGCGGNCGVIGIGRTPGTRNNAFAVAATNAGHVGSSPADGVWAYNDPQLRIDFAYRGPHVTAQAAKLILTAFYGRPPAYSYFEGCSDGGREGFQEAQRFPADFNGIVAGSPAHLITEAMERFMWEARNGLDADGREIIPPGKLALLHNEAMRACDALDGLVDGQIDDPRSCHYDPGKLQCAAGQSENCLTAQQVDVARKFYQGPVTADGKKLYPGGEPYGSELLWGGPGSFTHAGTDLANEFLKYMVFGDKKPPGYSWREWKFDEENLRSLIDGAKIYDANNPDLTGLRDAGGKFIIWQGWADNAAGAFGTLDYYQSVVDRMGGLAATQKFARVFMVPGVYHCRGGYMPYEQDLLTPLIRWVEQDKAPDAVIATATLADGAGIRRRPLYPYPMRAKYKGAGDINDAASFEGSMPSPVSNDTYDWIGPLTHRKGK